MAGLAPREGGARPASGSCRAPPGLTRTKSHASKSIAWLPFDLWLGREAPLPTRAPVATTSFSYEMVSPPAVVSVLAATSADTTRVLVRYSIPVGGGTLSGVTPSQKRPSGRRGSELSAELHAQTSQHFNGAWEHSSRPLSCRRSVPELTVLSIPRGLLALAAATNACVEPGEARKACE